MPRCSESPNGTRDVVYLAGVAWDAVRGTDRHLAVRLAVTDPVLWIDPPLSIAHLVRSRQLRRILQPIRVSVVAPGVRRVSVLSPPFPERRGMRRITRVWTGLVLRATLRRLGAHPAAVIGTSPYQSLSMVPRPSPGRCLYLATDDFVAGATLLGHSTRTLAAAERERLAEADVVAAVSPLLLKRWGLPGVVLTNGCDVSAFERVDSAPLPADVDLPQPVAGVVGQLSARLDLALLESVADTGLSLLLVGPLLPGLPAGRFEALVARANVRWVGAKSFEELPSYLRVIDVGLTPYTQSDFNRRSFPLKTMEYLAAGRAVVSTPLPAVDAMATDLVRTAGSPDQFAREVMQAAAHPRTPAEMIARRAYAADHDWSDRAADLRTTLGLGLPAREDVTEADNVDLVAKPASR